MAPPIANRKGAHVGAEQSRTSIERPSVSMPPPSKPSTDRRFSSSKPREENLLQTAASSSAGSLRGTVDMTPTTSPALGPAASMSDMAPSPATIATDATSVTTSSLSPGSGAVNPLSLTPNQQLNFGIAVQQAPVTASTPNLPRSDPDGSFPSRGQRPTRSSSRNPRRLSASTAASSAGSEAECMVNPSILGSQPDQRAAKPIGKIGVCALDVKARSKPSRSILTRLQSKGQFEVIVFGDKVILDEAVENWPICDFLLSFFSDGFPLDKAIAYVKLRRPFVINDLPMQKVLWDRRLCLRILDQMEVPTPRRVEVNRDGGPRLESVELARHLYQMTGVTLEGAEDGTGGGAPNTRKVELCDDGDTLLVDGKVFRKPFVEKPVSGEDHNVHIYFPRNENGGGGRRLFRKIGNKSSEYDPNLVTPRSITEQDSSYLYEQFLPVENSEDVKAYTVGAKYCHAETRKSPVVDGLVRRNNQGKELRYVTELNEEEKLMAAKVATGFGQRICGFDLLRAGDKSYVIDVNGWSFVKDNNEYYDQCTRILAELFTKEKEGVKESKPEDITPPATAPSRRPTSHGHRAALKTILKSPSMSKLHASHVGHRTHGAASPDLSSTTTPMASPLSIERTVLPSLPNFPFDNTELLPPPIMATTNGHSASIPSSPKSEEKPAPMPSSKHSWKLKGMVAVIRHADRTPKQKFKFTFHSQPFVDLLKGHQEEVLLKGEAALDSVQDAVKIAMEQKLEDADKLRMLRTALARKGAWPGTKVQIKPMFRKRKDEPSSDGKKPGTTSVPPPAAAVSANESSIPEHEPVHEFAMDGLTAERPIEATRSQTRSDSISGVTFSRFSAAENDLILDKLQLVIKWGGEPTHAARYQAQDVGTNMRDDMKLMNKEALHDVRIFTSSERRVSTSAAIWAASFLGQKDLSEDYISVRKDLLDDSNAAKDVMDKVKKKLKLLLREGNSAPPQFAWPKGTPEPSIVMANVVQLMKFHRRVMRHNFKKLNGSAVASLAAINNPTEDKDAALKSSSRALAEAQAMSSIQARWCSGEDAELFKERWEKLFTEFCDSEKVDPSKISELYDSMKFDALHNRQFLEWVFMPSQSLLDEIAKEENIDPPMSDTPEARSDPEPGVNRHDSVATSNDNKAHGLAHRMGFRRKSVLANPSTPPLSASEDVSDSYFKLYTGPTDTKAKLDKRLARLRELYKLAKVLFDFVGPQEYGITDDEKLEIGLLTSLPLLREIVADLEELQASPDSKSFIYFTKESHIYTLLNCILEGGIQTKISRTSIPELDYLSQICFELYEAKDIETESFNYSIRMSISPGCHSFDPLDVSLDSKHAIGCAPRRSLTAHQNWKEVIETLKAKFDTVKLPKSFLMVNLSDKHVAQRKEEAEANGNGGQ